MLYSTSFKNLVGNNDGHAHILTGVNAGATVNTGLGKIWVYAGTDPASADAALTGQTLLGVITSDGGVGTTLLTFAAMAAGILPKNATEVWSTGVMSGIVGTKVATYARWTEGSGIADEAAKSIAVDAGGTSTPRIHMSIRGPGVAPGDINIPNTSLTSASNIVLDNFQIDL